MAPDFHVRHWTDRRRPANRTDARRWDDGSTAVCYVTWRGWRQTRHSRNYVRERRKVCFSVFMELFSRVFLPHRSFQQLECEKTGRLLCCQLLSPGKWWFGCGQSTNQTKSHTKVWMPLELRESAACRFVQKRLFFPNNTQPYQHI